MPHIHTEPGQHDHTASAYIIRVDPTDSKPRVLFHMHKKYGILLQPGGHIELHETPWQAVLHEVIEETGYELKQLTLLQPNIMKLSSLQNGVVHPTSLCHNTHWGDDAHTHKHTDISYLFITNEMPNGLPDEDESADLRWFTIEELMALEDDTVASIAREVSQLAFGIVEENSWNAVPLTTFEA
jgi:8-oxo-dGTP diphosphatase